MKKLALALTLSSIMLAGTTAAQADDASHGMSIYGRLETAKSGCTVLMSQYVLNLNHDDRYLPVQGDYINFSRADNHLYIQLGGENCDANEGYNNIGLKFIGTADSIEGNTLANTNTSTDAAKGVGIQLTDMSYNIITPNVTVAKFPIAEMIDSSSTTSTASFPLYFSLVQLKNQKATPGNVQTNLTVQIERL
jgi:type 1 fimbria pilin